MDKFDAMRVFVEVAESNSFVAASRTLGLSAPAVTRTIARLESSLGVRLFNRTTRHVRLTDAGARFFDDAKRILEEVEQAEAMAAGNYAQPKGVLSVTAPVLFGQMHIAPILTEYLQANPAVTVRALFFDRISNMLDEGLDIAIRIGPLKDSSLHAICVGAVQRVVCASPRYLNEHGIPEHPADLSHHSIVVASTVEPSTGWRFETAGGKESVRITPRLYCSQNGTAISAVKQGFGITRLMSYQVGEELQSGSLTRILRDFEMEPLPVNIVYFGGRKASAKVRSFIDLAVERLRANPYINC
ncbi:MAG: LysR family transcriptional regulator [Gammaproteobacteria bacterium]|nr:MAG: LysR family transcriptional regulator [Gammaproteobacteria bacterium]